MRLELLSPAQRIACHWINITCFFTDDFVGNVRKDRRCGKEFPLPGGSGKPSQCDPKSDNYCCSQWGYCGGDADHCDCPTCFNYRLVAAASADGGN